MLADWLLNGELCEDLTGEHAVYMARHKEQQLRRHLSMSRNLTSPQDISLRDTLH